MATNLSDIRGQIEKIQKMVGEKDLSPEQKSSYLKQVESLQGQLKNISKVSAPQEVSTPQVVDFSTEDAMKNIYEKTEELYGKIPDMTEEQVERFKGIGEKIKELSVKHSGIPEPPEGFLERDEAQEGLVDIASIDIDDEVLKKINRSISDAMTIGIPESEQEQIQPVLDYYMNQKNISQDNILNMQKKLAEIGITDSAEQYKILLRDMGGGAALSKIQELSPQVAEAHSQLLDIQQRKIADLDQVDMTHGPGAFKDARMRQTEREYSTIEANKAIQLEALSSQLQAWQGNYDMARGYAMDMANLAQADQQMQYNILNTLITQQSQFYDSLKADEQTFLTNLRDYYEMEAADIKERMYAIAEMSISAIENGVELGWSPSRMQEFAESKDGLLKATSDYSSKTGVSPSAIPEEPNVFGGSDTGYYTWQYNEGTGEWNAKQVLSPGMKEIDGETYQWNNQSGKWVPFSPGSDVISFEEFKERVKEQYPDTDMSESELRTFYANEVEKIRGEGEVKLAKDRYSDAQLGRGAAAYAKEHGEEPDLEMFGNLSENVAIKYIWGEYADSSSIVVNNYSSWSAGSSIDNDN